MNQMELLAPAGSPEAVRAAVQSGAGAVYMGFGTFNARRNAKNFSREEMAEAISYCRVRGVKTNITFNVLALDRELDAALRDAAFLYEAGADALIVQDLGVARLIHNALPDFALHASTQLTIHSVDGAVQARELGFTRVVLARECSLADIHAITQEAGVETEVFVHGALCMCYSGQCYFSALVGQRSGNRGLCAQPCRLPYNDGYPLSLKDLSAADYIPQLQEIGVASLKIEGRMKRPEYTAIVTQIYADLIRENRKPTAKEKEALRLVFSRDGFTDGYLKNEKGPSMFGTKTDVSLEQVKPLYKAAAARFEQGKEAPLVPIAAACTINRNGMTLSLSDFQGNEVQSTDGRALEAAQKKVTQSQDVTKQLDKTGGTPFYVRQSEIHLEDGLMVPASRINAIRRDALEKLMHKRAKVERAATDMKRMETISTIASSFAGWSASVQTAQQAQALRDVGLKELYVPLHVAAKTGDTAVLPRIFRMQESDAVEQLLQRAVENGTSAVVCGNIGHIRLALRHGLSVIGDFGLNAMNQMTLATLKELGVTRQTISFENRLEQIRDMQKPLETELIVYGYLPLMITENSIQGTEENAQLKDRKGKHFAVLETEGARSTVLNCTPLWLATELEPLGITYARLYFTTERPEECTRLAHSLMCGEKPTGAYTNGLYFRGVE